MLYYRNVGMIVYYIRFSDHVVCEHVPNSYTVLHTMCDVHTI